MEFFLAFCIIWITIPSIVTVSRLKNLCVPTNGRTSHSYFTPALVGIAIFISFVLSTIIINGSHYISEMRYILAGMVIVFFLGIKDGILIIDPIKKLAGQIVAALLVAVFADIRITNLYGLFHVEQ
jgi:UDP-GlcNAc:undecaprenyl-phosphate GlcNAc-1-phosphate transferase